jgi:integrase
MWQGRVDFRLYDARHTFVTRLAENPTLSEETIRQLAGHVNPRMLARYAHFRAKARAKRSQPWKGQKPRRAQISGEGPHKIPHSRGIIGTAF